MNYDPACRVVKTAKDDIFVFQQKAMEFHFDGNRPHGIRQWATCAWNADLFYGKVPAIKLIAAVSWLIAYLS